MRSIRGGLPALVMLFLAIGSMIAAAADADDIKSVPGLVTYKFYGEELVDGSYDYRLRVNIDSNAFALNGLKPPSLFDPTQFPSKGTTSRGAKNTTGNEEIEVHRYITTTDPPSISEEKISFTIVRRPQKADDPVAIHIATSSNWEVPGHAPLSSRPNEKFYIIVLLKSTTVDADPAKSGKPVWVYSDPTNLKQILVQRRTSPPEEPKEAVFNFTVAPNEALTNGTQRTALQMPFSLYGHALFTGQQLGRFYFTSDNLVSSENRDKNAHLNAGIGFDRFVTIRTGKTSLSAGEDSFHSGYSYQQGVSAITNNLQVVRLQGLVQVKTDQTFTTESVYLETDVQTTLTHLKSRRPGGVIYANYGPFLTFYPVAYENYLAKNLTLVPEHANRNVLLSSLGMHWTPIFLGGGKSPTTEHSVYLDLQMRGWYFPNETATVGHSARHFEGRYDVQLNIPIRLPVRWQAPLDLVVAYGEGANSNNGYVRSSDFWVGLKVLGFTIK